MVLREYTYSGVPSAAPAPPARLARSKVGRRAAQTAPRSNRPRGSLRFRSRGRGYRRPAAVGWRWRSGASQMQAGQIRVQTSAGLPAVAPLGAEAGGGLGRPVRPGRILRNPRHVQRALDAASAGSTRRRKLQCERSRLSSLRIYHDRIRVSTSGLKRRCARWSGPLTRWMPGSIARAAAAC